MKYFHLNSRKSRRGIASTEFALLAVFLTGITVVTIDFGRVYFAGITLANAASSGAFYGAFAEDHAVDHSGMQQVAENDVEDLTGVTVSAEHYCQCSGGAPDPDCSASTCGSYGEPKIYVSVTALKTFDFVLGPPLLPESITLSRTVRMRAR